MIEVKAYKDVTGRLHADRTDAAEADLAWMIGQSWQSMPASNDKGDPATIARFLARNASALKRLRDALDTFTATMTAPQEDQSNALS